MKIEVYTNGALEVNTYLLIRDKNVVMIDPGSGVLPILGEIKDRGLNLSSVFVTHPHIDHLDGVPLVKKLYPAAKCYISEEATPMLQHIHSQARLFGLKDPGKIQFDGTLEATGTLTDNGLKINYFSTPGHCVGSMTFEVEGNLFSGDLLFKESVGRTDFVGGDMDLLRNSIEKKIFRYPDKTAVFPGHGEPTTIGHEKTNNPYLSF